LLAGLSVALALRAGLFNIGAEGQLLVGAFAAAVLGAQDLGLPLPIHLPLCLIAGALAGALWGAVPGALKAWRGSHEVIVTIMMNYIAIHFLHYLVNGPFRDPNSLSPATPPVLDTARLWSVRDAPELARSFGGSHLSLAVLIAIASAIAYAFLFRRTALGFEIRATGQGPDAARTAGIPRGRTLTVAMALSGALAGLAGACEALGVHRRYLDAFSPGYGFDSIAVALLGGGTAFGTTLSALLFGGLSSGALQMELATGAPRQIAGIVQAIAILAVGARLLRARRR
jgi:simple sugar transport system permease protein